MPKVMERQYRVALNPRRDCSLLDRLGPAQTMQWSLQLRGWLTRIVATSKTPCEIGLALPQIGPTHAGGCIFAGRIGSRPNGQPPASDRPSLTLCRQLSRDRVGSVGTSQDSRDEESLRRIR